MAKGADKSKQKADGAAAPVHSPVVPEDDKKQRADDLFSPFFARTSWTRSTYVSFIVITVLSFATRLYRLDFPRKVLFDEVHFVRFAQQYASGKRVFDIHGLIVWLTGFHTNVYYSEIGMEYKHDGYVLMRSWQGFCGALLAPVAFLCVRELGGSLPACSFAGLCVVLELSLQTISRAIFLDSFLYASIALGFYFALRMWHARSDKAFYGFTCLSGVFMGAAFSIKHTGLGVFGTVGVIHLVATLRAHWGKRGWGKFIRSVIDDRMFTAGILLILLFAGVHILAFWLHFLAGAEPRRYKWNLLRDIVELNFRMVEESQKHVFDHHHGSQWPEWPVLYRGLVYWWEELPDGTHTCVYLFGNPFVFWFVLLGVLAAFYIVDHKVWVSKVEGLRIPTGATWAMAVPLFGWVTNYLPYALFISRTCFVYHYHPSLFFGICLLGVVFDFITGSRVSTKWRVFTALSVFLAVIYWYYLPFSYALPITQDEHDQRRMLYFFPSLKKVFPIW